MESVVCRSERHSLDQSALVVIRVLHIGDKVPFLFLAGLGVQQRGPYRRTGLEARLWQAKFDFTDRSKFAACEL